jgi:hypothetical protein
MGMRDEVRDRLRDSLRDVPVPRGRIDDVFERVAVRQMRIRWRRQMGWVAVAALLLVGIIVPLVSLLPLGEQPGTDGATREGGSGEEIFSVGGVQVALPEGWDGRWYYIEGYTRPVVRLATFALPDADDIEGSEARARMQEGDVLLGLAEYTSICPCPGFEQASLPLSLAPGDFEDPYDVWHDLPPQSDVVPPSHVLARQTFETNHRYFDLWVEFGEEPASQQAQEAVSSVLASLQIGDYEEPTQPDGVCRGEYGPSKDPDCPGPIWIKSVLSEAGFQVVDSPQEQTLVGQGDGARFFIWIKEARAPLEEYDYPRYGVVDGVVIYGGEESLIWRAQGLDVWIAPGPEGTDTIPNQDGVARLVRATTEVPYPPEA